MRKSEMVAGGLHEALRTGPFEHALRLAIQASGLTLARVRARMAERGVAVGLATLSYWQRGRSRPRSAELVLALEEVLELPRGALRDLLSPARREPAPERAWYSVTPRQVCANAEAVQKLLVELNNPFDGQLTAQSVHEHLVLAPRRGIERLDLQILRQARIDGVDRDTVIAACEPGELPVRWRSEGTRLGRVATDHDSGVMAVEARFPHPLRRGENLLVDTVFEFTGSGQTCLAWGGGFRAGCQTYCLTVRFPAGDPPARVWRVFRPDNSSPTIDVGDIQVDGNFVAHFIDFDLPPGYYGMRWCWK
ncbi:hypothetical protein M8C13_21585 [Crossiella sp. SN42]|uniref:hypothetical protein n=1 Tax=Crossiella sp. SN42 TaxID=2944808 RepID=UPI00207CD752|nr:hypothetical protein [Crossiella sp. SN42]MCO1578349.1 hypothetical protein [Crossiella sp. SN42]